MCKNLFLKLRSVDLFGHRYKKRLFHLDRKYSMLKKRHEEYVEQSVAAELECSKKLMSLIDEVDELNREYTDLYEEYYKYKTTHISPTGGDEEEFRDVDSFSYALKSIYNGAEVSIGIGIGNMLLRFLTYHHGYNYCRRRWQWQKDEELFTIKEKVKK